MSSRVNEEAQWLQQLAEWLNTNITPWTGVDETRRKHFLSNENLQTFAKAFTHETYDYNNNYETMETVGDSLVGFLMLNLLSSKYPHFDNSTLSDLKSYYTTNTIHARLLKSIGGDKLIRTTLGTGIDKYEIVGDVFESLFQAIFIVANRVITNSGCAVCSNVYNRFYGSHNFDVEGLKGGFKPTVTQIFSKFSYLGTSLNEKETNTQDSSTVTISLTPDQYNLLERYGVEGFPKDFKATGTGETRPEASNIAYEKMATELYKYGVTKEWSTKIKLMEDLSEKGVKEYVEAALERARKEGYTSIAFDISRKLSSNIRKVISLLGVKPDGRQEVIMTAEGGADQPQIRSHLIKLYADGSTLRFSMVSPGRYETTKTNVIESNSSGATQRSRRGKR